MKMETEVRIAEYVVGMNTTVIGINVTTMAPFVSKTLLWIGLSFVLFGVLIINGLFEWLGDAIYGKEWRNEEV